MAEMSMSAWSWLVVSITDAAQQSAVLDTARSIADHRQSRLVTVSDIDAAAFRLGYLPRVAHELTVAGNEWRGYRGVCSCHHWTGYAVAQRSEAEAAFDEHRWAVMPLA